MSVNGALTSFGFQSWVVYFLIGCRHPFSKYWQPLLPKATATCSLPRPENELQRSVNSYSCCIFGNQDIALISAFIMELLTAVIHKNSMYQSDNIDSKLIDIASCKACKNLSLVVENAILIRYYSHTPKARPIIESMDRSSRWSADNPPNSDGLGVYHRTLPELTVWLYRHLRLPIWQRFGLDPDPDPKWPSGTIAHTTHIAWIYGNSARVHEEPHVLHQSRKARQECVEPRAVNDRQFISYTKMMSVYPRVSEIYTPHCSVYLEYLTISIHLVVKSVSIIPVSPYASCWLPSAEKVEVVRNRFSRRNALQVHL